VRRGSQARSRSRNSAAAQGLAQTMTTRDENERSLSSGRMPVTFAAHGAPNLLDDEQWMGELAAWAKEMPKPKNVLMVSAHWEERPTTLGATRTVPLAYDFWGPPRSTTGPATGAPAHPRRHARPGPPSPEEHRFRRRLATSVRRGVTLRGGLPCGEAGLWRGQRGGPRCGRCGRPMAGMGTAGPRRAGAVAPSGPFPAPRAS